MARIRTIKPEFFTSEDVVALSPLARLLYIALWCEADREGRLLWKPRTFKMRYLPADTCEIDELSKEIVRAGLVHIYGEGFAHIPAFSRHQHINPREAASVLPCPPGPARVDHASTTRDARVATCESLVSDAQVGKEGKGKEGKEHASRTRAADAARALTIEDLKAEGVDPQHAADWMNVRKGKKAGPVTVTAWAGLKREAAKAGIAPAEAVQECAERGWQSLKADWLLGDRAQATRQAQPRPLLEADHDFGSDE